MYVLCYVRISYILLKAFLDASSQVIATAKEEQVVSVGAINITKIKTPERLSTS